MAGPDPIEVRAVIVDTLDLIRSYVREDNPDVIDVAHRAYEAGFYEVARMIVGLLQFADSALGKVLIDCGGDPNDLDQKLQILVGLEAAMRPIDG